MSPEFRKMEFEASETEAAYEAFLAKVRRALKDDFPYLSDKEGLASDLFHDDCSVADTVSEIGAVFGGTGG